MKTIIAALLLALIATACTRKSESGTAVVSTPRHNQGESGSKRHLAYEHSIEIDLRESEVQPAYEKLIKTCNDDEQIQCTLLDARIVSEHEISAQLRMRVTPEGRLKLVTLAAANGKLTRQSTHVEDLAEPVADVAKRIAMLQDYQKRLLELQARDSNVDALIKIAEKVAEIQADLERTSGKSAELTKRVKLELLNIGFSTRGSRSLWAPIGDSLRKFPASLSDGASSAITGLGYALPWTLALLLLALVLRFAWRRIKRR